MNCIICNEPADMTSVYVPGDNTRLIIGTPKEGQITLVPFGICSSHLDDNGEIPADIADQVKKTIFNKIREGNVPRFEGDVDGLLGS